MVVAVRCAFKSAEESLIKTDFLRDLNERNIIYSLNLLVEAKKGDQWAFSHGREGSVGRRSRWNCCRLCTRPRIF